MSSPSEAAPKRPPFDWHGDRRLRYGFVLPRCDDVRAAAKTPISKVSPSWWGGKAMQVERRTELRTERRFSNSLAVVPYTFGRTEVEKTSLLPFFPSVWRTWFQVDREKRFAVPFALPHTVPPAWLDLDSASH